MPLLSTADFFSKSAFSNNSYRNTMGVLNGLNPHQDRRSVGPGVGPNCKQRLSTADKIIASKERDTVKFRYRSGRPDCTELSRTFQWLFLVHPYRQHGDVL